MLFSDIPSLHGALVSVVSCPVSSSRVTASSGGGGQYFLWGPAMERVGASKRGVSLSRVVSYPFSYHESWCPHPHRARVARLCGTSWIVTLGVEEEGKSGENGPNRLSPRRDRCGREGSIAPQREERNTRHNIDYRCEEDTLSRTSRVQRAHGHLCHAKLCVRIALLWLRLDTSNARVGHGCIVYVKGPALTFGPSSSY